MTGVERLRATGALLLATGLITGGSPAPAPGDRLPVVPSDLPRVIPNDNRVPAGRLHGDTLELDLEIRMATWYPEADSGPGVEVAAFAEAGTAPTIPAPLIRVREGTVVIARVRNLLTDSAVTLRGLLTRPAEREAEARDTLLLRPGESTVVTFDAGMPGTYAYAGMIGMRNLEVDDERDQLAGAFIVDPASGSPPDRVFVMNIWGRTVDSATYGNALTINGRSWPWTERITAATGDTLRWRVVNASVRNHPMHLHGFYFRLDAIGDWRTDTILPAKDRRMLVTQVLRPYETMTLTWSPDRPGNWLFHCHIGFHVLPGARVNPVADGHPDYGAHDPERHMSGLVLGIAVTPGPTFRAEERVAAEHLRLFIQEGRPKARAKRTLAFVLQRDGRAPRSDSVELPGSPLILTRGRPTDITIINRTRETSVIHWHGIELESYSDGVAGWSGAGDRLAPSIEPGDSFTARLTLRRAGTFMYHTHLNDLEQLASGLYGGIIVREPDEPYDPARDHLFVVGWDGFEEDSMGPQSLVNGEQAAAPLHLAAHVPNRFRFVNIGPAAGVRFLVYRDSSLVTWRMVAKDGADLPVHRAKEGPAERIVAVGETFDAQVSLPPGEYRLVATRNREFPFYVRRLIVR